MFFVKKKKTVVKKTQKSNVNSAGKQIDRLTKEGELPFGWIGRNHDFTKDIESKNRYFFSNYVESEQKSPIELHSAVKSYVIFLEEAKTICHEKGECFGKWFDDLVADQDYIDKYKRQMFYIENNMDKLMNEYNRKTYIENNIVPNLKNELLNIISENPDILQKDIYKKFDSDVKEYISRELYYMEKDFYIIREKSGNTYKLNIMQ